MLIGEIDFVLVIRWSARFTASGMEGQFKGYGFETELDQFRPDYNPNVIATLKGEEVSARAPALPLRQTYQCRGHRCDFL